MKIYLYILFISLLIFTSCASATSPTGGPRDEDPPILLEVDPPDQSLNVSQDEITFEFNEYVQVLELKEQLLVTPRLTEDVEAIVKKRSVVIKFNEELQPNTTYTLNFRDAISDITEKNPVVNLKYAFSTGSYIDSAYITGNVIDLLTQKPAKSIAVGVYKAGDTLNIINQAPDYMTITDEEGNFRIDNLKKGRYNIYALKDGNRNSQLDMQSEVYGFLADTLELDTAITGLSIPLLRNDLRPIEISSARTSGKYFVARTNKYLNDVEVEGNISDSIAYKIEADHLSIKFYNTIQSDSLELLLNMIDSIGLTAQDTIMLKFAVSPRAIDDYSITITAEPVISSRKIMRGTIHFNKPSAILNKDSLYLSVDTLSYLPIPDSTFKWNKTRTRMDLTYDLTRLINDSTNTRAMNLRAAASSFTSVESDTNKIANAKIQYIPLEQSGNIEVEVNSSGLGFIVQLLGTDYRVKQQEQDKQKFSFIHLPPGSYILRVLIDANGDGRWDPGNMLEGREPEPVMIYLKSDGTPNLQLKANWVLGPNIINLNPVDN